MPILDGWTDLVHHAEHSRHRKKGFVEVDHPPELGKSASHTALDPNMP